MKESRRAMNQKKSKPYSKTLNKPATDKSKEGWEQTFGKKKVKK